MRVYMCVCTHGRRQQQAADWTAHLEEVLNHSRASLLRHPHAVGGAAGPVVGVTTCRAKVTPQGRRFGLLGRTEGGSGAFKDLTSSL